MMESLVTSKAEAIFNTIDRVDSFEQLNLSDLHTYYSFLNEYAENHNIVLLLLNKLTLDYENVTPNFNQFWGLEEKEIIHSFKEFYPRVLEDIRNLEECIGVHEELMESFSEEDKMYFTSTFCGVKAKTLLAEPIRLVWHSVPLILNGQKQSKILLCYQKDIIHLMEGDIYWIRVATKNKVYTWFSNEKKIRNKEIISKTELICIKNWAKGKNAKEIAELQYNSINTVNNHLKAARKRLGLRNNTALVDICHLLSI